METQRIVVYLILVFLLTGLPVHAQQPAPAPSGPLRTETINYDAWMVTCQDTVGSTAKKKCSAILRLVEQQQNRQQVLLVWVMGLNPEGRLMTVLKVPTGVVVKNNDNTTSTGILVSKGMEIKFGNAPVRRINYVSCEPQWCDASTAIDDAFIKEATAAPSATVSMTVANGNNFSFPPITIKGIDKAIASVRK